MNRCTIFDQKIFETHYNSYQMIETNHQEEDCQICLEPLDSSVNLTCHTFHHDCLQKHIRLHCQDSIFPIKCPCEGCQTEIQLKLIRRVNIELEDIYCESKLKQFLRTNAPKIKYCPTTDCLGVVEYEKQIKKKYFYDRCKDCNFLNCKCYCKQHICSQCQKQYCLECSQSHIGLTCIQFQHNNKIDVGKNKFIDYLVKAKVKKCPSCQMWVERTTGCDHMACKCGTQFCYGCSCAQGLCICKTKKNPINIYPVRQHYFEPRKRVEKIEKQEKQEKQEKKEEKVKKVLKPTVFKLDFPPKPSQRTLPIWR